MILYHLQKSKVPLLKDLNMADQKQFCFVYYEMISDHFRPFTLQVPNPAARGKTPPHHRHLSYRALAHQAADVAGFKVTCGFGQSMVFLNHNLMGQQIIGWEPMIFCQKRSGFHQFMEVEIKGLTNQTSSAGRVWGPLGDVFGEVSFPEKTPRTPKLPSQGWTVLRSNPHTNPH